MNYQLELEHIIDTLDYPKRLLLHSCCAPCSSYVLEWLSKYFQITVYFYNPNIEDVDEYTKRMLEQKRLIQAMNELPETIHKIQMIEDGFEAALFPELVQGYETQPEGGARCGICFRHRLEATAKLGSAMDFDYFATTLTISPLKNSNLLNEIGFALEKECQIQYLPSDFKKKEGYKKSTDLSKKYDLYRQSYCGCIFSKRQREEEMRKKDSK